jgi:hypothetical protein
MRMLGTGARGLLGVTPDKGGARIGRTDVEAAHKEEP